MIRLRTSLPTITRLGLGAVFLLFGANGFLGFLPQPPMPAEAMGFIGGLASAGYFFPLLKATEVLIGLSLLAGRWVPLALTVAAPIIVNILAFHLLLSPGLALPLAMLVAEVALAWWYRDAFRPLLQARSEVRRVEAGERRLERALST
jgi:putative oxidoreductase